MNWFQGKSKDITHIRFNNVASAVGSNRFFAASDDGLWVSEDGGVNFKQCTMP
jgi:hypothetical protein